MLPFNMEKYGLFAAHDSGAPGDNNDYTTLILIHGLAWHAGIFSRLLPLAEKFNARLVLVNRRDYPGSVPLSDEELHQISSINPTMPKADALPVLKDYMKQRAQEIYDFLSVFIQAKKIATDGRVVVAGWSFGAAWITALLANVMELTSGDLRLSSYIHRFVLYDPPYHTLGYPPPKDFYNPLSDPSLPPGEGVKLFPSWVSGYYLHGNRPSELEHRKALSNPRPTVETLSSQEIEAALYPAPANPGGSDSILMESGIKYGLYSFLREASLFVNAGSSSSGSNSDNWSAVQVRYVWCDQSVWEMPWGTWALQAELDEAKKLGKLSRDIQILKVEGANHFAHWDRPDRTLQALLSDDILEDRRAVKVSSQL